MNSSYMRRKVPRKADGKIDFSVRKHHGFSLVIMICGFLLPPLAVAVRFGIGKDFFINVILTLCGYFPGHGHNFFLQNIRNNENRGRTPKWAKRYGLVDDSDAKHQAKKRAWVGRYNEQAPRRQMYDDDGNVYEYDYNHRFEDGDNPHKPRRAASTGEEHFYENGDAGHDGASRAGGATGSLRSRSSLSSLRRRPSGLDGMDDDGGGGGLAPGAGDAERRRAKSKSRTRALLGSRKNKSDRHARSEQVMGTDGGDFLQQRMPYDEASLDSLGSSSNASGVAGRGRGANGRSHRDDYEGPEDADDTVGKRYAERANGGRGHTTGGGDPLQGRGAPPPKSRPVDIMDDHHQF